MTLFKRAAAVLIIVAAIMAPAVPLGWEDYFLILAGLVMTSTVIAWAIFVLIEWWTGQ